VSTAFRFILQAREKLYNSGILATVRLDHPVISVGNLTLGGTGKTPLVIALAEGLRQRGLQPVILSRGYRRQSRDIVIAGRDWKLAGDEPCLMSRRLGDVPVVVGADRYEAGRLAERGHLGNVFILDDGFQHRRLYRDVDILTIDPVEWNAGEALLPTGRWREPKSAIGRAHAACVQEMAGAEIPSLPIPTFVVRTEIQGLFRNEVPVSLESLHGKTVVAFAGVAKPERFFSALEALGIRPVKRVSFGDHHSYSRRDIEKLQGEVLITTEKDAVRLTGQEFPDFVYLRISANIPGFERLMKLILERLPESGGTDA
jgi:tetraacyldisaccharide 4'-kinase